MYVPGMAPFDQQEMMKKSRNIKLYVRRVFISDQFDEDLMPRYLNFVKGVVDSNDLPLNVSREILQESKIVRVMRKRLLRKTIDMLKDLQSKDAEYKTFWEARIASGGRGFDLMPLVLSVRPRDCAGCVDALPLLACCLCCSVRMLAV